MLHSTKLKGRRRNWSATSLDAALYAINKGSSLRLAAMKYDIPKCEHADT